MINNKRKSINPLVTPVLKWAGGKRQLIKDIHSHLPNKIENYCELFLGGGAVLFSLQPKQAIVNDINEELINVYKIIQNQVDDLIIDLRRHDNSPEYFYKIRGADRNTNFHSLSAVERASRIIYLNKTCYNGLFRVNSQGQFNVPFGSYKSPNIINETTLKAVSNYLQKSKIIFHSCDFESLEKNIKNNSFVYLDPPYHPLSDSSSFTGYSLNGFNAHDQERLKQLYDTLSKKSCKILLSNSDCKFIRSLYKDYEIIKVEASRAINSNGSMRGKISEVLIKNY
jgi:DNA adenine methylase